MGEAMPASLLRLTIASLMLAAPLVSAHAPWKDCLCLHRVEHWSFMGISTADEIAKKIKARDLAHGHQEQPPQPPSEQHHQHGQHAQHEHQQQQHQEQQSPMALYTVEPTKLPSYQAVDAHDYPRWKVLHKGEFEPLKFNDYDEDKLGKLSNTGHSMQFTLSLEPDDGSPSIEGAGLEGEYKLKQWHVHFPAEHVIVGEDGKPVVCDLEIHFVHEKENANGGKPHLAVMAVLFKLIDNQARTQEEGTAALYQEKELIPYLDQGISIGNDLMRKLPTNPPEEELIAYEGSLTTPDYRQGVQWRVFPKPKSLSHAEMKALLLLHDGDGHPVAGHCRKLQPPNGREMVLMTPSPRS